MTQSNPLPVLQQPNSQNALAPSGGQPPASGQQPSSGQPSSSGPSPAKDQPPAKGQATGPIPPVYFGPDPTVAFCRNCNCNVVTRTRPVNGAITYLCFLVFAHFACCCLPFLIDAFRDVEHFCPSCNIPLTAHKRLAL